MKNNHIYALGMYKIPWESKQSRPEGSWSEDALKLQVGISL